jgi:hypothetical protein
MRSLLIVVLLAALAYSVAIVAKLENYRYANSLGMCVDGYDLKNATSLVSREDCLMRTRPRTSWWWSAIYGFGIF